MWGYTNGLFAVLEVLIIASTCQGRFISAPRTSNHIIAEPNPQYYFTNIDGYPGTYSYGYDVADPATGNVQFRTEERYPNGTVVGSYGYVDTVGKPHRYRYIADEKGYRVMRDRSNQLYGAHAMTSSIADPPRVSITTEPSVTWTRPSKRRNNVHAKYIYTYGGNEIV